MGSGGTGRTSALALGAGNDADIMYLWLEPHKAIFGSGFGAPPTYPVVTVLDTDGGRLGIGQAPPDRKLVVGAGTDTPVHPHDGAVVNLGAQAQISVINSAIHAQAGIVVHADGNVYMGSWTNHPVIFRTNNTDRLAITTAGYFGFANRVGIGTNAPQKWLEVGNGLDTPLDATDGILVNIPTHAAVTVRNAANNVEMGMLAWSDSAYVGSWSNHPLSLRTNATDRVTVTTTGRVGIGITGPQKLLEVGTGAGTPVDATDGVLVNLPGQAAVTVRNSLHAVEMGLLAWTDATYLGAWSNHPLTLRTNNLGRMTITTAGRVGIAITAPQKLLEVGDGGDTAINGVDGLLVNIPAQATVTVRNSLHDVEMGMMTWTDTAYLGAWSNHPLVLRTNNLDRLTIATTGVVSTPGNVGIGTTNPQKLLEVGAGGDTAINTAAGILVNIAAQATLTVRNALNDIELGLWAETSAAYMGSWSNSDLHIRTNNVNRLSFNTAGNVYVGTPSSNPAMYFLGRATNQPHIMSYNDTLVLDGDIGINSAATINFYSAGDVLLAYGNGSGTGKVGIGTYAPGARLHVMGSNGAAFGADYNMGDSLIVENATSSFINIISGSEPTDISGILFSDNVRGVGRIAFLQWGNGFTFDINGVEILHLYGTGGLTCQGIYDATTTGSPNVVVGSGGALIRSTSSLRYKRNVVAMDDRYGPQFVLA